MRYRHLMLTEGQNYDQMFNGLRGLKYAPENIDQIIAQKVSHAKQTLRRKDRIDWYCRWMRITLLMAYINNMREMANHGGSNPERIDETKGLWTKYVRSLRSDDQHTIQGATAYMASGRFDTDMKHFLSLEIDTIQNFTWEFQDPFQLHEIFTEMEKEWASKQDQYLTYDEGEEPTVFVKLGKGWAWYDLETHSCSQEGKAMGHCGNAGGSWGDTVLSLRHRQFLNGKIRHRPSLTFILDDDGYLGEMKGRGNDKPSEKYHDAIEKLLRDPRVHGIKGGGYMPKNNFRTTDMDEQKRKALVAEKPTMMDIPDLHDLYWEQMNSEDAEQKEKAPETAELLRAALQRWADENTHGHDDPKFDIPNDKIIYDSFNDYHSYTQYYNGRCSIATDMFEPEYLGDSRKGPSPLTLALMHHEHLDRDEAEKLNNEARYRLKKHLITIFLPYDLDFYDGTEIELNDKGHIKIVGDLEEFIQRWLVENETYDSDRGLIPYVDNHSNMSEIIDDAEPLVMAMVSYIDEVSSWRDRNQHKIGGHRPIPNRHLAHMIVKEFGEDAAASGSPTTADFKQRDFGFPVE